MSGEELFKTVRELSAAGKLPDGEVTNELILAAVMDTLGEVKKINGRLIGVEADIDTIKRNHDESPSLIYLLRHKTGKTTKVLVTLFFFTVAVSSIVAGVPALKEIILAAMMP